jgi:ABC-2 type transport system ATP-binding protein
MTVELQNVTIRYGDQVAVADVSVVFEAGAVGLLGRNGAGKSSILKALLGLVKPSGGSMRILDLPENADAATVRSQVGYMPERDAHLPQASGFEMVSLLGMLSGMPRRDAWRRAHEVLYLVGLEEQRYRPVAGYSAGMRQKVKLAAALVHDPQVLFLDEPTNGLDPSGREDMLRLVRQLCRELGKSVVLSTHILQDVEAVCDGVVVLEKGRVVASGPLRDLTRVTERRVAFAVEPAEVDVLGALGAGFKVRHDGGGRYTAWLLDDDPTQPLFAGVLRAGGAISEFVPQRRSLEEVFLHAVQGESEGRASAQGFPRAGESVSDASGSAAPEVGWVERRQP